jgi:hypothetical protein
MAFLKSVGKKLAEKATQGALESVAKKAPRMSEALNPQVGKRLYITQADRTALDYDQGLLGGPGFVDLAEIDPAKYKDIAWAVQSPGVAKTLVGSMARNPEEAVFANLIGSPEQHRSNKVVFDRIMDRFQKAVEEDKLTPELRETINKRLSNIKDPKTGKSFFPEDVDILSPEFNQHAQTFHQRAYIADILAGKGVGGKKGSIIDYPQVIKETTDPLLLEAKTGDIGDRLFSLSGNIQERPELHPAFHYSLSGKKESEAFAPAPQGIVLKNFTKDFTERTGRLPTYYDLTRGYAPSEKITDEMLERMYKEGYAGGGLAKSIGKNVAEKIAKKAKDYKPTKGKISEVQDYIRDAKGEYGAQRVERAADLVPNLEKQYSARALREAFDGDNAKSVMVMNPADYEKYARQLPETYGKTTSGIMFKQGKQVPVTIPAEESYYDILTGKNPLNREDYTTKKMNLDAYLDYLGKTARGEGLLETPYLMLDESLGKYYQIAGHEGRHRSRALEKLGDESTLIRLLPRGIREGLPRSSQEEYQEGLRELLGPNPKVYPEKPYGLPNDKGRKLIDLPDFFAEGGSVEKDPEQIRDMIKSILGSDIQKAEGGTIATPEIEVTPDEKIETLKEVPRTGKISGKIADVLKPASRFLEKYEIIPQIPLIGGTDLAELTGVKGVQTLAEDMSYGYKPIRNLERGKLQASYFDPRILDAVDLTGTAVGVPILAKNLGKTAIKEGMKQIETGEGMLGRNVINPRMNIIKDQGGMLVGGEKALDDELIAMKHNESAYPHAQAHYVASDKDPNAVALNQWVDTKVRKYLRNQAGTEADPILKTIESGVKHNFQPTMGDTKYSVRNKRLQVGKPEAGIAKTELGKEFEYKIDSMFDPKSSEEVKAILNDPLPFANPNTAERFRASKLRTELDLPIQNEKDVEALRLLNEIPDKNVYTLSGTNITDRLGLNHVSDVLMEDLQTGRLRPEQLNQMSIEKAIRRAAEYDAEKAKAMAKANASSVEGMPIPKQYNDGYKWVELKHDTDPKRTEKALKSEGEMMGHCVGGYCPDVESGEIKIFSLRSPDGKSHVTIEARPQFSMTLWRNANMDAINSNPKLKKYDFNMRSLDDDNKYGRQMTERDYVREMTKEMKKLGINPVEPPSYMELHQVKGKQNKRPDDKYQSYISDFIKNNPTKHEIVDVYELDNTNLMGVQNIADNGLVSKDIHNHPEVEKILKMKYPEEFRTDQPNVPKAFSRSEELKYELFQEVARDFARQNKNYLDKDDILNHLREKYLLPKKKSGGSINLNQEYKLENMRRRYG